MNIQAEPIYTIVIPRKDTNVRQQDGRASVEEEEKVEYMTMRELREITLKITEFSV